MVGAPDDKIHINYMEFSNKQLHLQMHAVGLLYILENKKSYAHLVN